MSARHPSLRGPEDLLADGASAMGVHLDPGQIQAFRLYREEITRWSARTNLTAMRDPGEIILDGFLDSLACLPFVPRDAVQLLDIGSGAGFPALPIKLVRPSLHVTLVEASRKKTTFLRHMARCLRLQEVRVIMARAEELATDREERGRYDVALARAVAPLRRQALLAEPFLRLGGLFLAQVGPGSGTVESVTEAAGLAFELVEETPLPSILGRPNRRVVALRRHERRGEC